MYRPSDRLPNLSIIVFRSGSNIFVGSSMLAQCSNLLVDFVKERAKGRGRRTGIENSPLGDSQGHGFIERGVMSVVGDDIGLGTSLDNMVFAWVVEHTQSQQASR